MTEKEVKRIRLDEPGEYDVPKNKLRLVSILNLERVLRVTITEVNEGKSNSENRHEV